MDLKNTDNLGPNLAFFMLKFKCFFKNRKIKDFINLQNK